jgi:hypothetical protein
MQAPSTVREAGLEALGPCRRGKEKRANEDKTLQDIKNLAGPSDRRQAGCNVPQDVTFMVSTFSFGDRNLCRVCCVHASSAGQYLAGGRSRGEIRLTTRPSLTKKVSNMNT